MEGAIDMRRRPRLDATQHAIVEALQTAGYSVVSIASLGGGAPDLLVGGGRRWMLLFECKTEGERHRDTREHPPDAAIQLTRHHPD